MICGTSSTEWRISDGRENHQRKGNPVQVPGLLRWQQRRGSPLPSHKLSALAIPPWKRKESDRSYRNSPGIILSNFSGVRISLAPTTFSANNTISIFFVVADRAWYVLVRQNGHFKKHAVAHQFPQQIIRQHFIPPPKRNPETWH